MPRKPQEMPDRICENEACRKTYNRTRTASGLERPGNYLKRRYCSMPCCMADVKGYSSPVAKTRRQRELIEDYTWIRGTDGIVSIANRLGFRHPITLERSLHRAGESRLANEVRGQYQHYLDAAGEA